jgi:ribosome-binding protein aMBF1 (putative translation factor)
VATVSEQLSIINKAINDGEVSYRVLAAEAGLAHSTLQAWGAGAIPRADKLERAYNALLRIREQGGEAK